MCGHALNHQGETGQDPAVAARPEHLLAVGLTQGKEALVAIVEMLGGIVKSSRGQVPLVVHELDVALVAGGHGELGKDGRRHVERVAPPPEEVLWIVGAGKDLVQVVAGGVEHSGVVVRRVKGEVGKADGFVVGVAQARSELPVVLLGDGQDPVAVAGIAGGTGGSE